MVSLFYWQQLLPAISEVLLTPSSALLLSTILLCQRGYVFGRNCLSVDISKMCEQISMGFSE